MDILPKDKVFRYLTIALALIAVGLLVKEIFFKPPSLDISDLSFPMPQINIETDVFENIEIEELTPFEQIIPLEFTGRAKPFEPYSLEEYEAAKEAYYASLEIATSTEEVATSTEE